jgi:ethanolamine permease
LSGLGAVVVYMVSMISLFVLRRKEPDLERSFRAPLYVVFPAIALVAKGCDLTDKEFERAWQSTPGW